MLISLYTLPNCAESEQTRAALASHGIPFTERNAVDQSPLIAPVIATVVAGDIVAWRGHHPEFIELLADLVSQGPVPGHGLPYRELAEEAVVTRQQALVEVWGHQLDPQEFLKECGDQPLYRGKVLLDWLGY